MLCEKCQKNSATVHLTEIKSGMREEKHLCEACARSMNLPHNPILSVDTLDGLIGAIFQKGQKKGQASLKAEASCPHCGMTLSEFKNKGRLGCAYDYVQFQEEMEQLLQKVHGSTRYVGKVPEGHNREPVYLNELHTLKDRLRKAVKTEEYEEAARIRDRIRELESLVEPNEPEREDR